MLDPTAMVQVVLRLKPLPLKPEEVSVERRCRSRVTVKSWARKMYITLRPLYRERGLIKVGRGILDWGKTEKLQ